MLLLQLLFVFTTLMIILFQKIDVRITKCEKLTVKINFIFLAIEFTEVKKDNRCFKQYPGLLRNIRAIYRSARYLFLSTKIHFLNNPDDRISDEIRPVINLSLHFSLLRLIISLFIFLYYTVKYKIKRVIKNV